MSKNEVCVWHVCVLLISPPLAVWSKLHLCVSFDRGTWLCFCMCECVCAPVCSCCWSFDPGSPWRQWLRQHHAGDKIDVYSPPKQQQNINTVGTVGKQPHCVFLTEMRWYHTLQTHASVHLCSDKWQWRGTVGDGITLMVSRKNPREGITLWKSDAVVYLYLQHVRRNGIKHTAVEQGCSWVLPPVGACTWRVSVVVFSNGSVLTLFYSPNLVSLLPKSRASVLNHYVFTMIAVLGVPVIPAKRWYSPQRWEKDKGSLWL